jgi:hypothetical protein
LQPLGQGLKPVFFKHTVRRHKWPLFLYSICTSPLACDDAAACAGAGRWGSRQKSKIETWCTHDTVQCGAQDF